ncbi:MAG: ATP-dependent 6-phosphofructokinase [Dehalococcoidales bacterium]|nr:ATP-dependent 6-phosphofructokinase [Dehalococcoidales bacterium]
MNRIGILSGGGDCAGINPAIKWVVKTALDERLQRERGLRYEVIGIRDGWRGLLEVTTLPLDQEIVRTWDRYGGTMLGTSRTNPGNPENDRTQTVLDNIEKLGLSAVIAIGGDDTLSVAYRLHQAGISVVGIPKTIDKDLPETDYTLGFETAVNVITEEIDRLRTTAGSHQRIFVVETMGRHSGWLALEGGESSGAFIILIPECDFVPENIYRLVREGRRDGARYNIIVAAEGAKPVGGAEFVRESSLDAFGHKKLGGIAEALAREIERATVLETRSVKLSHLQRGGAPCAYDRRMGRYFGIAAVDLVTANDFGKMVCLKNGRITACPLECVIGRTGFVDVATQYDAERYNGRRTILGDRNNTNRRQQ